MSDHLRLNFKPSEIHAYQKDILTLGLCSLFLPVGIVEEHERVILLYDTDGLCFPDQIPGLRAYRALSIMRSLLDGVMEAERRYFPAGSYRISPELLMVNGKDDSAHLIFIPARYPDRDAFMDDLKKVIVSMKPYLPGDEQGYMDEASSYFSIRSGLTILRHRLSMLENEASVIHQADTRSSAFGS